MARQNEQAAAAPSPVPSVQQKKYGSVAQMKRGRSTQGPPPSHYYSQQGPSTQSFEQQYQPQQQQNYQPQQQQTYQHQQGYQQQSHHAEIEPDYEFDDEDCVDDSRDTLPPPTNGHRVSMTDNQSTYSSEYARGRRPQQQPPPPPPMMQTPRQQQQPQTNYSNQATRSAPPVPQMQQPHSELRLID